MATPVDWTHTAAKWGAALILGGASLAGMAWSLSGRKPAVIQRQVVPESRAESPAAPPTEPKASPEPIAATPVISLPHAKDAAASEAPATPPPAPAAGHKVNLNTASQAELELLPGIGPALATRILEFRAANGKFQAVDQLDKVKGIGPRTLAKLRPLVTVE